jgi:UDP-glucose 4-epimerase
MHCLVTGGAGFIGSCLVDRLLSIGHSVVAIDDFSSGKREHLQDHPKLKAYMQSACEVLQELFEGNAFDVIFHLAAIPNVQRSIAEPQTTNQVNLGGTLNLLEYCKEFDVPRFVFTSSAAVYGNQPVLPHTEIMLPQPQSPYAVQKLASEQYCSMYHQLHGIKTVALRLFNVYGPRQNPEGSYAAAIPRFINKVLSKERPQIYGDGSQTRDFLYVDDAVDALIAAAKTEHTACFGDVMNVGAGEEAAVTHVIETLARVSHCTIRPGYAPAVPEIRRSRADIAKIQALLGWKPKTSFEDGLARTCRYFAEEHERIRAEQ